MAKVNSVNDCFSFVDFLFQFVAGLAAFFFPLRRVDKRTKNGPADHRHGGETASVNAHMGVLSGPSLEATIVLISEQSREPGGPCLYSKKLLNIRRHKSAADLKLHVAVNSFSCCRAMTFIFKIG